MLKKIYASTKVFFALLGGLLLIIQIYQFFTQSRSNLYATFALNQVRAPHRFDSIAQAASMHHLRFQVDSLLLSAEGKTIKRTAAKSNENNHPDDFLYDFFTHHSNQADLFVRNTGDKEILNIKVVYQGSFYYEYVDNEGTRREGEANESFTIPAMRPTEYLFIRIWALNPYVNLKVTYPDGAITASLNHSVSGLTGAIAEFINEGPWIWAFSLPLAYVLFVFYNFAYKRGFTAKIAASKKAEQ
ncbi:MAG TPA: hypothetical protein VNS58_08895 [Puia sp.]|nr:hypothetical protein [Puia sp.]